MSPFRRRMVGLPVQIAWRFIVPVLHFIIILTILAALLIFVAGLPWLYVAVGYAVLLLLVIALYHR